MTWLELYNFLHTKANDVKNLDSKIWQDKVIFYNVEDNIQTECDTLIFEDDPKKTLFLSQAKLD